MHTHKPKFGLVLFFIYFLFFLLKPFQISSCSFSFFFFSCFLILVSFLLFTSFLLAGKVWTKSSVNPEKGTLISSRCVGLFMHRFCTKKGACFFRLAQSECSRYTKWTVLNGKIYPHCVSCLSEKLTDVKIDHVTSCTMTTTPNVDKSWLWQCIYMYVNSTLLNQPALFYNFLTKILHVHLFSPLIQHNENQEQWITKNCVCVYVYLRMRLQKPTQTCDA